VQASDVLMRKIARVRKEKDDIHITFHEPEFLSHHINVRMTEA
jgi:hypothetical protein